MYAIIKIQRKRLCKAKKIKIRLKKENEKMTRNIRNNENEMMDMRLMAENCNCSIYTMGAVAAGILFCVGIILYALIAG